MSPVEVRKALRKFKPFIVHLADGRSLEVPHPDWALLTPTGRTLILYQRDDSSEDIDVKLMTSIELPANFKPKAKKQNGS